MTTNRNFGKIFGFLCLTASSAFAQDDEAAFRDRVRAYLMDHPQVIIEALEQLSAHEEKAAMTARITSFPQLFIEAPILGMGAAEAPVRVIEFFDYKCAPCKAIHPSLKAFVVDNPQLRVEMRHLPILSPASERATRFALAARLVAGDDSYRHAHDLLWSHRGPYNTATFARMAKDLELDFPVIEVAMDNKAVSQRISENRDIAIALAVLGTPAFVTKTTVSFGQSDVAALGQSWLSQ